MHLRRLTQTLTLVAAASALGSHRTSTPVMNANGFKPIQLRRVYNSGWTPSTTIGGTRRSDAQVSRVERFTVTRELGSA